MPDHDQSMRRELFQKQEQARDATADRAAGKSRELERNATRENNSSASGVDREQRRGQENEKLQKRWAELDEPSEKRLKEGFMNVRDAADAANSALEAMRKKLDKGEARDRDRDESTSRSQSQDAAERKDVSNRETNKTAEARDEEQLKNIDDAARAVERETAGARRDVAGVREEARQGKEPDLDGAEVSLQRRREAIESALKSVEESISRRDENRERSAEATRTQSQDKKETPGEEMSRRGEREQSKEATEARDRDEKALAHRWDELSEADEAKLKEQFRAVRSEADGATRSIDSAERTIEERHAREREEKAAQDAINAATPADNDLEQRRDADLESRQARERRAIAELREEVGREERGGRRDIAEARQTAGRDNEATEVATERLDQRADTLRQLKADAEALEEAVRTTEQDADRDLKDSLQRQYSDLVNDVAPYDELRKRTMKFNAGVRAAYELERDSLEYAGLRLDAEHFIDQRFFKPFEREFKELGIESGKKMPAFAVHYERHIRSPESLSEQAKSGRLPGESLTQEKLKALPHDDARKRYGTLATLLEKFEDFWKNQKSWSRIEPELTRLRKEAERRRL